MPRRLLIPISYGGKSVRSNPGREAWLEVPDGSLNTPLHSEVALGRVGNFPAYVRSQPEGKIFPLHLTFNSGDTEGQFEAISRDFDPTLGLRTLIVQDACGNQKQVQCVPTQIIADGIEEREWIIPLWAPNPLLESVTQETLTGQLGDNTSEIPAAYTPITLSPFNDGTYNTFPTFTITPSLAKTARMGWALMHEVTYAWRSELPATGPFSNTWLLELTDEWDTSALIDVSAISTTTTDAIAGGAVAPFDLNVVSTAGFDSAGTLLITPGGSQEQFEYYVIDATTVRIVSRAKGGTAAVGHANGATVHQSRMLEDGRDIAVFVDGVQVPAEKVNIDGIDTTTTKVWIEINDRPRQSAKFAEAIIAGTTSFIMDRESHGFVAGDYLSWVNDAAAFEQARVTSVDGITLIVVRAVRNAAAAGATAADVDIFRSGHHIQVAYNFTNAPARPTNPDPPLIDLNISTNVHWEWNTAPIDNTIGHRRAGSFRPIIYSGRGDDPRLLQNRLASKVGLAVSGVAAQFTDVEPNAGQPNFDAIEFVAACGIDDTANSILYDASIGYGFALHVITRDFRGFETLLSSRLGHETGNSHLPPFIYTAQDEDPGEPLSAVIFRARNIICTGGFFGPSGAFEPLAPKDTNGDEAQEFILDENSEFRGMLLQLRKETAGNQNVIARFDRVATQGGPGAQVSQEMIFAVNFTGFDIICFHADELIAQPVYPAGTYFLRIYEQASSDVSLFKTALGAPVYPRGARWEFDGDAWSDIPGVDIWFAWLSETVDNQSEVLSASQRSGEVVDIDTILLDFDDTKPRTPIIDFRPSETAYYYNTSFTRAAESFTFRYLDRNSGASTITIDVAERSVIDNRYGDEIRQTIDADTNEWLRILPFGNTVTITAVDGAVDEDHSMAWRDRWQS